MKKLIYLEDAINEIARWIGYLDKDMISRIQIGLERLPSAQPEIEERMSETEQNVPNDDFISRKRAIDAIEAVFPVDPMKSEYAQGIACGAALAKTYVEQLPSAQPEIVRCNSCKYWTQSTGEMKGYGLGRCDFHDADLVACNGFCYWAERRTDE